MAGFGEKQTFLKASGLVDRPWLMRPGGRLLVLVTGTGARCRQPGLRLLGLGRVNGLCVICPLYRGRLLLVGTMS